MTSVFVSEVQFVVNDFRKIFKTVKGELHCMCGKNVGSRVKPDKLPGVKENQKTGGD